MVEPRWREQIDQKNAAKRALPPQCLRLVMGGWAWKTCGCFITARCPQLPTVATALDTPNPPPRHNLVARSSGEFCTVLHLRTEESGTQVTVASRPLQTGVFLPQRAYPWGARVGSSHLTPFFQPRSQSGCGPARPCSFWFIYATKFLLKVPSQLDLYFFCSNWIAFGRYYYFSRHFSGILAENCRAHFFNAP